MRVAVWLQFLRPVRMAVRAVFSRMVVFVLSRIANVGMCVRMLMLMFVLVNMIVFVRVRDPIVGVFMGMSVNVLVLMFVGMIVHAFHRSSSFLPGWCKASCRLL